MHIPRWIRHLPFISPARRLAWYPPFRAMSIRVEHLSADWRHAVIRLPLNGFNRNPGDGMFGGAVAALADPIPALSCNKVFPGHQLWTRKLQVDYLREGRTDLTLRFDFPEALETAIREELARRGRASPEFEFGFYDDNDRLCVRVINKVAIRPGDYRPGKQHK